MNSVRTNSRLALIALCLFLVAALSACSSNTDSPAPSTENSAPAAELAALQLGPDVDVSTVAEVKDRPDVLVLDVREQWEYDEMHIPGITLIPMDTVPNRLSEIPKDKEVIVTCRSGNRSSQVVNFLREQGFTNVHNMTGGILAWQAAGYAVEK